jgi:hypothetical protein
MGFNGKCLGEVSLPMPAERSSAAEAAPDSPPPAVPEASAAAIYCPSCHSKMRLLPSSKVWCSVCKTMSEVRTATPALLIAAIIGVILLIGFTFFYAQGAFDHLFYNVGLNWETCALNSGDVLCGQELGLGADSATDSVKEGVKTRI